MEKVFASVSSSSPLSVAVARPSAIPFPLAAILQKMQRQTIETDYLRTIDWIGNEIVDWNSAGMCYSLDGKKKQLQKYHFGFNCDNSITSKCGNYAFIFKKLGTKGLLLKNGEVLREINRTYYQSESYEFPATFLEYNGKTFLVHCPNSYCQIDFEDVETGEILTNISERKPQDIFHSRLEVSPDNKYILSKGWIWHPMDVIELYDVEEGFKNPISLDSGKNIPNSTTEICSASFINNDKIILSSSSESFDEENDIIPTNHIAIWNFKEDKIERIIKPKAEVRNIFAIDENYCWDLYKYPKIIDLKNGDIKSQIPEIFSGYQCSSIIGFIEKLPKIAYNKKNKKIAISSEDKIEVLSTE